MITKTIGQVTFDLNEDFDCSFIAEYGEPFAVFDQQDSGNLCFGVIGANGKLFLKTAGAATVRSHYTQEEAVERLKANADIYTDLRHPKLTKLLEHRAINSGYLLVFEWFNGECMGNQYTSRDKFLCLPQAGKLDIYQDVLAFHQHVNDKDYIAIDFYDGSIMYDFTTHESMICDVELYQKKPVVNSIGRMPGSSRYMSPEEFELGAVIDERSNVFCMGAAAFDLFGGGKDRSFEKWSLSEPLYKVAMKAVSTDKQDRYYSIGAYMEAWTDTDDYK